MADNFKAFSDAMANIVETAGNSIVRVEGRKRLGATGMIWQSDGVIVTADHVVRRDEGVQVNLPDGKTVPASVVGRARNHDVAVLKVDADLTPLPRPEDELRVGNLVLAVGRPAEHPQATLGAVSAIGTRRMDHAIRTDVVMYPGFSGGPLMDAAGQVRGMNTSGFRSGASIAIPNAQIDHIATSLLEHGKMKQGYLGVGAQPVRLPEALAEELDQETGLMLASVESGSPAEAGGLLLGDVIVKLDDDPTPTLDALLALLSGARVGEDVTVRLVRGGQLQDVTVTIGERE